MSWLIVNGMQYHCTECGYSFKVDYEGEPRHLQVGEARIFQQIELDEKYGLETPSTQETYWEKPHYLHEECICAKCYETNFASKQQDSINATMEDVISLIEQTAQHRCTYNELYTRECVNELNAWINSIDFNVLQSIDSDSYSNTIGHRLFSFPANRKDLRQRYFSRAQDVLLNRAITILNESATLLTIVERYLNIIKPLADQVIASIKSVYDIGGVSSFSDDPKEIILVIYSVSVKSKCNLNQYICTEDTIWIPSASAPEKSVYYLSLYSVDQIFATLQGYLGEDALAYSPVSGVDTRIDKKQFEKQLLQRMEQLSRH